MTSLMWSSWQKMRPSSRFSTRRYTLRVASCKTRWHWMWSKRSKTGSVVTRILTTFRRSAPRWERTSSRWNGSHCSFLRYSQSLLYRTGASETTCMCQVLAGTSVILRITRTRTCLSWHLAWPPFWPFSPTSYSLSSLWCACSSRSVARVLSVGPAACWVWC